MKSTKFNDGWKFWEVTNSFALNWAPPEDAKVVDLPHDAMIEIPQDPDSRSGANTGYRKGGVYSYSKTLRATDPGRTYILKIEGAYMNAFVYVNGQLAAKRPFGYTVFYVPLNKYLDFTKENEIRVQVRSGAEPNSRWYPGTGLYRDVYLLESGPAYIKPDLVQIKTLSIPDSVMRANEAKNSDNSAADSDPYSYENILKNIFKDNQAQNEASASGSESPAPETPESEKPASMTDLYKAKIEARKAGISMPEQNTAADTAADISAAAAKAASSAGNFTVKATLPSAAEKAAYAMGGNCAIINVSAVIADRTGDTPGYLEIEIRDPAGKTSNTAIVQIGKDRCTDESASAFACCPILEGCDSPELSETVYYPAETMIAVPDPLLWDIDAPNLYTCCLTLKSADGNVIDTHCDTFGIRTLSLSPEKGFRVNGREVKLRGACIHHDSGMLGSKTYDDVHLRQIRILKEAGFNAIRCAHNPAAPALLRACDEVGMYVMDEAFDIWTRHKSDYDYGMYFEEWWKADVEAMVRNSFNHPSVIMYSVGNEIPEICTAQGGRITKMICDTIKSIDDTRYTLASVNGMFCVGDDLPKIVSDVAADLESQGRFEGNVNDFMGFMHKYMNDMTNHPIVDKAISVPFQHTDIAGYNYMGSRYDIEHDLHPERVIVGSETGIGDLCFNWERVKKYPYVIGDFCWTGWEYLGEAGIGMPNYSNGNNPFGNAAFPLQVSGTGCIDISGHRLPMSYYREIVFGLRKDPYIAVQDPAHYGEELIRNPWIISDAIDSWSWNDYIGKKVVIEVYSDSDEVELFKNGESLGHKNAGYANNCMAFFETTYEPGTLTAVSYSKNLSEAQSGTPDSDEMHETGRFEISSPQEDAKLRISEEAYDCGVNDECAGSEESRIHFINIDISDENGVIAADRQLELHLNNTDNVKVLAFGSADPYPVHNYNENDARTWRGRAQLIVQKINEAASAAITVTADDSQECSINL